MPQIAPEAEFRAVYEAWSAGRLTRADAATKLDMCERTFSRYVSRFRENGSQWWQDRAGHRVSRRRASDEELATLIGLYASQYPGWAVRHFYDRYRREHGGSRSYTWVKDALQRAGLVERRARDAASKRRRKERTPIGRKPREGMLVHQVASRREWVAGHRCDLIVTVDDASNRVCSGFLVAARGIWSVLGGIRETLDQGLFDSLHLHMALPSRLSPEETVFGGHTKSQLERVMKELGIEVCYSDPALRTRPMRVIGSLQRRLPRELAAAAIVEVDLANRYLSRYWTRFNHSFGRLPTDASSAFVPLTVRNREKLRDVLCLKHEIGVHNGHQVLCEGKPLDVAEQVRQQLHASENYRIHEYENGDCALFNGRCRVMAMKKADHRLALP
ncbi:MAG: hypothetical protein F4139_10345 [Gemmatimonadetes bacterium]|nr:hypothetical protein [Gemmatimonadota bacterium]MYA64950.1 hypothetical protein [Gemmatimonadota bacterium]MYB98124.1 hypothetical protein [Gemmatimonadota bacterium]MYH53335.1 hypothetical protein [Gemmatimonadota bacterium]MYI45945.1 hypothetical protein [Gemmatimonadota bacterium]